MDSDITQRDTIGFDLSHTQSNHRDTQNLMIHKNDISMESSITQGCTMGSSVLPDQRCHRDTVDSPSSFQEHLNGGQHFNKAVPSAIVYSNGSRAIEIPLFLFFHFESISMESDITQGGTIGSGVLER